MHNSLNTSHTELLQTQKKVSTNYLLRVLVVLCSLSIYTALLLGIITNSQGFIAYTLLLIVYLVVEIKNLRIREPNLIWINPVVLASLVTFILSFGFSNIIYFMPERLVVLVGLSVVVTSWMNQLMLLVVLGACSMWFGYSSGVGRTVGLMMQQSRLLHSWIPPSEHLNKHAIYVCLFISIAARLWSIKLGLYGYSASYDNLIASANISEYLNMADWLGKLVLMVVAIQYYSLSKPTFTDRHLLWFLIVYQVAFGFISGMKSNVVIPFFVVAIACYCQQNRFPRWLLPTVVIAVLAAYTVIEPFRNSRHENANFSGTSLESIVSTMTDISSIRKFESNKSAPVWLSFIARNNLTYIASLGIEYAENNILPDGSPQFLSNILLAPAHALVPRFLWNNKPIQQDGLWYTHKVVGYDIFSSTAMSPFTYLNFAGGPLAVILGFLFLGIIQRGLFDGLRGFGTGGVIVLLGLLNTLGAIDSSFNSVFVGIIRYFPILVVVQYILFQHHYRS